MIKLIKVDARSQSGSNDKRLNNGEIRINFNVRVPSK